MNNMKHYLFMVIAAVALTFTACGSKESKQKQLIDFGVFYGKVKPRNADEV